MNLAALVAWMVLHPLLSPPVVNQTDATPPPGWATGLTAAMLTAYVTTTAVDVGQTLVGLRRGHTEINPLLAWAEREPFVIGAIRVGVAVATTAVLLRRPLDHWKRTLILSAVLAAINVAAIIHNQRVLAR